ncbi:MAG TPA: porin [Candidatus Dormibacteraeota bacterium]|nr:porin [Candidatus Dormibacteraeota bacterium]
MPATACAVRARRLVVAAACLPVFGLGGRAVAQNVPYPGPEDDQSLSFKGITLYGIVDIGLQYQTHGAPASDYIAYSTEPVIQKNSNHSITALTSSPLSWSRIGLAGKEPLAGDWSGLFRLEVYFNPTSGTLSDGLKSLTLNNGRALGEQTANLDSSVAGQVFGGGAVLGVSSPRYGTLTLGRQSTVLAEGIIRYDPVEDGQDSGHAFSLLGGSRTAAGGGVTQDTRLDHSLKYGARYDWLHLGALYQFTDAGGSQNTALQAQLGASIGALSLDAYYARKYDAISASALSSGQLAGLHPGYGASNSLAATVSDNTAYAVMGLYAFEAVTLYGGYERIRFANPRTPLTAGYLDIGGYVLAYVNNAAYANERVLQVFWGGAKWRVTRDFYLAAGYYGYRQNSFATGASSGCSSRASSGCSGSESAFGLLGDYRFNRRCDAYLGTLWTQVQDGLASGFLNTSTLTTTLGIRARF